LYDSNLRDLLPYTFIELNKNYTRNLISTDNNNYTLILICWNPKRESPIHNHPCQGCWFRIIKGNIYEKLFTITPKDNYLSIVEEKHYKEGDVSFIDDTIALHKVGNLTDEIAMTLHLYMPPIDNCKIWFDENDKKSIVIKNTFHSKEGKILHLLTFQTPIFTALKKIKSIKSIVGISPTMVLLFHLPCFYLKM
jgi:cysteine dioxygenase